MPKGKDKWTEGEPKTPKEIWAARVAETIVKRVLNNPYIPHTPFTRQAAFLSLLDKEALYGGAAGGGKSDALLMAALMYVQEEGYNSILFRKTYSDLSLPEAIMSRSHEWLADTPAHWDGSNYRWTFPTKSTLSFGYLNHDKDKFRYQSSAYQMIGFDELTQFDSAGYLYLFSRLRKLIGMDHIPLRMRGGTNPGGTGNDWVYERFVAKGSGRPFVPALLDDNPYIDQAEYRLSLAELDETTRNQLEFGLWVVDPLGKPFKAEWFTNQNRFIWSFGQENVIGRWISWDTAFEDKDTSAFSSAVVVELLSNYRIRLVEVWRGKPSFPDLTEIMVEMYQQWNRDGKLKGIIIEGQASGKPAIQTLRKGSDPILAGLIVEYAPKGNKLERASSAALWAKRGMLDLPHPSTEVPWLDAFERELFGFPEGTFKDQVDALSQGMLFLENYLVSGWHGLKAAREARKPENRVTKAKSDSKKQGYSV
jgi:predicted phage terminase large subunit-like protein